MAKKPALTPRERNVASQLANNKYLEAINSVEDLLESTTILQDLLFLKGVGANVPQSEITQARKKVEKFSAKAIQDTVNTTSYNKYVVKQFITVEVD